MQRIPLNIQEGRGTITLGVEGGTGRIPLSIEHVREEYIDYPIYDGPYIVTPEIEAFVLPVKEHAMRDDLIIREIPYYETSNPAGGYTAIIGG